MGRDRLPLLCLALAAALSLPAFGQHQHASEPTTADAGVGVGTLSFPTSTRVPAAQQAFERGMAWLHLFEYEKARVAFVEAQKQDKDFALAYWGEAMTYANRIWKYDAAPEGRAALAKLGPAPEARAAKAPTPREKAFLDTAEQLYGDGTIEERHARYLASAERLAAQFPDDDEARLLHALALFGADPAGRNAAQYAQAAQLAGTVLARNRQHPGAAHYLIHAVDDPEHAAEGLDAARALADLNPASPHAQHMTSHIFFGLGRWDDAIAANLAAMEAAQALRNGKGQPPLRCGHAVDWLQYAYFQAGRVREARQTLANCIHDAGVVTARAMMQPPEKEAVLGQQFLLQDSLLEQYVTTLVESGRDGTRDAQLSVDTGSAGRFGARALFARGYVAALAGDVERARDFLTRLRGVAEQPAAEGEYDPRLGEHLAVQSDMLEALVDAEEGRMDVAVKRVRAAADVHDAIPFQFGPPRVAKPPRELLGELLLRQGNAAEALAAFDAALKDAPNRALSLLGRARALKALGDAAGTAGAYAKLAAQWHKADATWPAVAEVRAGAHDAAATQQTAR